MDLNKHIATNDSASHFHSSGYAKVAYGSRVGSTTTESFGMRRKIDASRQFVNSYHRSSIGNAYAVNRLNSASNRGVYRPSNNNITAKQFNTPTVRKYNPYA